jgi:predicted RNA-binding Zn-ribbon protein involved in translation (DUF1610 family)
LKNQYVWVVLVVAVSAALLLLLIGWMLWRLVERGFYRSATCPRCGAARIRRSEMRQRGDRFLRLFSLRAYRCRVCGFRFHNARWSRLPDPEEIQPIVWKPRGAEAMPRSRKARPEETGPEEVPVEPAEEVVAAPPIRPEGADLREVIADEDSIPDVPRPDWALDETAGELESLPDCPEPADKKDRRPFRVRLRMRK